MTRLGNTKHSNADVLPAPAALPSPGGRHTKIGGSKNGAAKVPVPLDVSKASASNMAGTSGVGQSWVDQQQRRQDAKGAKPKPDGELHRLARSFSELPDCVMKLICMVTLLLSDADLGFTYISFYAYYNAEFMLPIYVVTVFTVLYLGGAYLGAREGLMFYQRFRRSVRRNEIQKLKIKELEMYMGGGYLLLDPQDRKIREAYARDELVVSCQMNFDVLMPPDDAPSPREETPQLLTERLPGGGGGALANIFGRSAAAEGALVAAPPPTPLPSRSASKRPRRVGDGVSFFKLQQAAREVLQTLDAGEDGEYEAVVRQCKALLEVHQETEAAIKLGLKKEIVAELKRKTRRYLKVLAARKQPRRAAAGGAGATGMDDALPSAGMAGAVGAVGQDVEAATPPPHRHVAMSPALVPTPFSDAGGADGGGGVEADAEGLPERLYLDEHYHPRKNLISAYTDEERERIICDVFLSLKDNDVRASPLPPSPAPPCHTAPSDNPWHPRRTTLRKVL